MEKVVFESTRTPFIFLPFLIHASVITADDEGLMWVIQSRIGRIVIRNIQMMKLGWGQVRRIERDNTGILPGIRIFPNDPNLFRAPVSQYGPIRVRLRVAADGSGVMKMASEQRATELFAACNAFLAKLYVG